MVDNCGGETMVTARVTQWAVVTSATSGIGRASVLAPAQNGINVGLV